MSDFEHNASGEPQVKARLLHKAVKKGNIVSLKYLLKRHGENVDVLEEHRQTALMMASYTKYKSAKLQKNVLDLILDSNPKLNIRDNQGRTALIHACSANNSFVVKMLLSEHLSDIRIDTQDNYGMTGLMYAVQNNNLKMASSILLPWKRFGLSRYIENKNGENVMDIALKENNGKMIDLLKEYGFHATKTTNQRAQTASYEVSRVDKKYDEERGKIRRTKSSIAAFRQKKKNKISVESAPHNNDASQNKPMRNLHKLFDIYAEQLSTSYKEGAKTPVCLADRDDSVSMDSFGSGQSFRSVSATDRYTDFFDSMDVSGPPKQTRTRRTGASLLVPNTGGGRSRKISAPCFPSSPMLFNVNTKRQVRALHLI